MAKKTQKKAKPAAKSKTVAKKITKSAVKTKAKPVASKAKKTVKSSAKVMKPSAKKVKPSAKSKQTVKSTKAKSSAKSATTVKLSAKVTIPKAVKVDFANWVTPLDDRILVQLAEEERVTPGGLYIPDTVADVSGNFKGLVVAIGRGHLDKKGRIRPLDVKNGDTVVFSQFSGSKIEYQGQTVIFLREADVLGIVNK